MFSLSSIDRSGALYRGLRRVRSEASRRRYNVRGAHPTSFLAPGSWIASDLEAGEHVFIGPGCSVEAGVRIGRFTMLAADVAIVGADHRMDAVGVPMQFAGRDPLPPTSIGEDCWLGHGAKVMVGVTIGDYCIVAAGSIVTKDVPEGSIVAGVPGRVLRPRFTSTAELEAHRAGLAEWKFDGEFSQPRSGAEVEAQ